MTKQIFNLIIAIKNSQKSKRNIIQIHRKKLSENLLKLLWDEGFISGYKVNSKNFHFIDVLLKYSNAGKPTINSVKFLSKPGSRLYFSSKQIWKLDSSKACVIFSTSKGLMTINNCKKKNIGGEPLVILN